MTSSWTLMSTFSHFPTFLLVPMFIGSITQHTAVKHYKSFLRYFAPLSSPHLIYCCVALALQELIGRSDRNHLFGIEVKLVENIPLEQMHKTCLETSAACALLEQLARQRLESEIKELRYLHRRQPHRWEKESQATALEWTLAKPPSCSALRRTFKNNKSLSVLLNLPDWEFGHQTFSFLPPALVSSEEHGCVVISEVERCIYRCDSRREAQVGDVFWKTLFNF